MNLQEVRSKIKTARAKIESANAELDRLIDQRDGMLIEKNKDKFGDIAWLVNNPNTPGQYEAMKAWFVENFGGEYLGVTTGGYYPDINQSAFGFHFDRYDDEKDVDRNIENVKKFVDLVLPHLKPVSDGYASFTYATGQYSGIFNILYHFESETWWTANTRYSRQYDLKQHGSLDDAIALARVIEARIDD